MSKPSISSTPIPQFLSENPRPHLLPTSISKLYQNPHLKIPIKTHFSRNLIGFRYISTWGSNLGGKAVDLNLVKGRIKAPVKGVLDVFSRYKDALGLQIDGFLRRNSLVLLGGGGVFVCVLLWKIMFVIANSFIGLSEGVAKYGFLALSPAIVSFAGLYIRSRLPGVSLEAASLFIWDRGKAGYILPSSDPTVALLSVGYTEYDDDDDDDDIRSRFTINPDKVYRMAMRKLNASAGVLEIMGAPLAGTDLRAYVLSGGGITLKNFKVRLRSKRCFLIFPIRGAEMKGFVSVEVKNKKGQYDMKLLSVDIPMATGPDQRLFIIGDEEEYRVGGGLISELRDPAVKAMSAAKEFEERDIQEEKEDAQRKLEDAERKRREEV